LIYVKNAAKFQRNGVLGQEPFQCGNVQEKGRLKEAATEQVRK